MARKPLPPRLVQQGSSWYVVFTEGGRSQRQSLRTEDFSTAQTRFAGWLDARDKYESAIKAPTFDLAFKLYLEQHGQRNSASPVTLEFVGVALNEYFGDMRLEEIVSKHIHAYTARRLKGYNHEVGGQRKYRRAVSPGTVRKELSIMRAVFNFMVKRVEPRELRMDSRMLCYIELPPRPAARQRVLSEAELAKLRELCRPPAEPSRVDRLERFLWLLMETGARAGALRDLTWNQVDLTNGFIQLNPYGRVQTNKRRPVVPISDALRPIIERAKAEATTGYVLDHPGQIRKSFDRFVIKHALADVTAHTFRHTFATRLAQAGVSMVEIAQLLGDSIMTVEKNYLHYSPEHLRSAINRLSSPSVSDISTHADSSREEPF